MSVDLYVENTLAQARLIIVRLLGGRGYWPYGVEQIAAVCRERGIAVAFLPGDDQPDAELASLSSLPPDAQHRLWRYLVEGGIDNAVELLRFAGSLIGRRGRGRSPRRCSTPASTGQGAPLPSWRHYGRDHWGEAAAPVAALVFIARWFRPVTSPSSTR